MAPVSQAATIARGRLKIGCMNFHAPHDQASDQKAREAFLASHAAFVASLPPSWREPIFVINCSSDSNVNVELKSPVSAKLALAGC